MGPRTASVGLLVVEDSCDRMGLLRAQIAGCSSRSRAVLAVTVVAFAGQVEEVAAMKGAGEVCSSRSVP
jgi:hypothetical protein